MVNSKSKGNRNEREVVKLCKDWWGSDEFMRAPESGAMATILEYHGAPEDITGRLAGDIMVPLDFPFCIESKAYASIDLWAVIRNPETNLIRQWWEQCKDDARKAKKIPLLTIKEDRKKRFIIISREDYLTKLEGKELDIPNIELQIDNEYVIMFEWSDFVNLYPRERF